MEQFWEAPDMVEVAASLSEILMGAISTPLLRIEIPVGTQYELPLERRWVPLGFKTTDERYRWPPG